MVNPPILTPNEISDLGSIVWLCGACFITSLFSTNPPILPQVYLSVPPEIARSRVAT